MHPRTIWIVLGVLAVFAVQAAVIYKWTDANGVVHYSDQAEPGAEKIYTAAPNTSAASSRATAATQGAKKTPSGGLSFSTMSITSPAKEQTFFGDETVAVNLALAPPLTPEQTITWHLNGKQLNDEPADATSFALLRLDRGTYAIAATVTDQRTGESQSTDSITFYVRQPSTFSPQHKNP